MGQSVRRERLVNLRLFQCPGCWSYGVYRAAPDVELECECGERLTLIDLRARREQPLTEDAH